MRTVLLIVLRVQWSIDLTVAVLFKFVIKPISPKSCPSPNSRILNGLLLSPSMSDCTCSCCCCSLPPESPKYFSPDNCLLSFLNKGASLAANAYCDAFLVIACCSANTGSIEYLLMMTTTLPIVMNRTSSESSSYLIISSDGKNRRIFRLLIMNSVSTKEHERKTETLSIIGR